MPDLIAIAEGFFNRRIKKLRAEADAYDDPPIGYRRAPAAARNCNGQADALVKLRDSLLVELRRA